MTDPIKFDLRIVITGICSLVTEKPLSQNPKELHLVIPDAWDVRKETSYKGIDDKYYLVRHGAMIQFPVQNVAGMQNANGGKLIWYPKRHNLSFDFTQAEDAENTFKIVPATRKIVADMTMIASKFLHVGRNVLSGDPPKEILANATFHGGRLSAEPGEIEWYFDGTLGGGSKVKVENMSYKIILAFEKLTEMSVKAVPFFASDIKKPRAGNPGSTAPAEFKVIGSKEGGSVEIIIANACDMNPLDWRDEYAEYSLDDRDFKWHYEILTEKKDDVRTELNKGRTVKELPYPTRTVTVMGAGRNCFPAFWAV